MNVYAFTIRHHTIFGMQSGCGINDEAAAFGYSKGMAKRSVLAAGVVLNNGKTPIVELMY